MLAIRDRTRVISSSEKEADEVLQDSPAQHGDPFFGVGLLPWILQPSG